LLNDAGFFEFAQALARRVLKEAPAKHRIDYAFELCTARKPNRVERKRLQQVIDQQLDSYKAAPEEAREITGVEKEAGNAGQLAAWTTVARVLLNLDETISRE